MSGFFVGDYFNGLNKNVVLFLGGIFVSEIVIILLIADIKKA